MKSQSWQRMNAAAWWLGARLCQRTPGLYLEISHPGGGQYDVLGVRHHAAPRFSVDMNRNGSLHVHDWEQPSVPSSWMPLQDLVLHDSLEDLAHRIERAAGWAPSTPARTTRRVLTYRVLAAVLQSTVGSREPFDARMVLPGHAGLFDVEVPLLTLDAVEHLPGVMPFVKFVEQSSPLHAPGNSLWALLAADRAVALFDSRARVLTSRGVLDLQAIYRAHGRRISATTADALGHLLP